MEPTSVLITGANKGLGLETARRLGEQGWTIFLGSRDPGRGQAAADQLTARGVNVIMIPLEVTSDQSVADAVRLVRRHTDRLDVLVNNAGAAGNIVAPADVTVEEIHSVYDTNVYGPIRVTNAFLPLLRVTDNPRVVMVSRSSNSPPSTPTDRPLPSSTASAPSPGNRTHPTRGRARGASRGPHVPHLETTRTPRHATTN